MLLPTWVIPGDAPQTRALVDAYTELYGAPKVDKWTFSTNGVAIMGRHGIPCIGLGPGKKPSTRTQRNHLEEDLVRCAAICSVMPKLYVDITKKLGQIAFRNPEPGLPQ